MFGTLWREILSNFFFLLTGFAMVVSREFLLLSLNIVSCSRTHKEIWKALTFVKSLFVTVTGFF